MTTEAEIDRRGEEEGGAGETGKKDDKNGRILELLDLLDKSLLTLSASLLTLSKDTRDEQPTGGQGSAKNSNDPQLNSNDPHLVGGVIAGVLEAIEAVAVQCVGGVVGGCRDGGGGKHFFFDASKLESRLQLRGTRSHPFRLADGTWVRPALLLRR